MPPFSTSTGWLSAGGRRLAEASACDLLLALGDLVETSSRVHERWQVVFDGGADDGVVGVEVAVCQVVRGGNQTFVAGFVCVGHDRSMDREQVFAVATAERLGIADLLEGLDDQQLAQPSLCAGWDVKTVAAHLVSTLTDGVGSFLRLAMRRGGMARAIDELARRRAQAPASEIIAALRDHADRRMSPPTVGPLESLADVLVHAGDIRIPLGLRFEPAMEPVGAALDFLTGPWRSAFVPRRLLRGISLRGADLAQTWGSGAEVSGPVAALMMSAAGRPALSGLLAGPGAPRLVDRLST
jgi:uncharacterized protein (TIGR03083 family)